MKKSLLLCLLIISSGFYIAKGQLTINVSNSGFDHIVYEFGEPFPDASNILFTSGTKLPRYDESLKTKGLSFRNGMTNTINHSITSDKNGGAQALYSAPVIEVSGSETVLIINDTLITDNGESYPAISLWDGGRFILSANAYMDLIAHSYFTRQLWVWSDGTGIFEIKEGFIADRTAMGTTPEGVGSLRFNNCTIITHHTDGLPMGYRPLIDTENDLDTADINSHFVFEEDSGSVWVVNSNPQNYRGGLWIDASMTVETNQELTISGVKTVTNYNPGGPYSNWGGVMMRKNLCMTKRGAERLVLSGDHGYDSGAVHYIEEGMLEYQTDPFTDTSNVGYLITYKGSTITSPNLKIEVADDATVYFNTSLTRIDSIAIASTGRLRTKLHNTIQTNKTAFSGTLEIIIPDGTTLQENDTFFLFNYNNEATGSFSDILLDDLAGDIDWNLSSLYSDGFIYVQSGSGTSNIRSIEQDNDDPAIDIFPNPAKTQLSIKSDNHITLRYELINMTGKKVLSGKKETGEIINIENLPEGIYFLQLFDKNNKIVTSEKIIKL